MRGVSQVRSITLSTLQCVTTLPNSKGSDRKVKQILVHTLSLILPHSCGIPQHGVRLWGQNIPPELDRHSRTCRDNPGNHHLTFVSGSCRFCMGGVSITCGMPGRASPCGCYSGSPGSVPFCLPRRGGKGAEDHPCIEQGKPVFIPFPSLRW